jgi:hypothetical protein
MNEIEKMMVIITETSRKTVSNDFFLEFGRIITFDGAKF